MSWWVFLRWRSAKYKTLFTLGIYDQSNPSLSHPRPPAPARPRILSSYEIGCTQYALNQLEKERFVKAIWLIIKRILSCIRDLK